MANINPSLWKYITSSKPDICGFFVNATSIQLSEISVMQNKCKITKTLIMENNLARTIHCNPRKAINILYPRNIVCVRYMIVNALLKGGGGGGNNHCKIRQ
jgi:hypothetical protein